MIGSGSRMKRSVARILSRSGLNHLRGSVLPRIAILTYHRVLPREEAVRYAFTGMTVTTTQFEAHMGRLARCYHVVDLPAAVECMRRGDIPRRAVAVTFDDGYRDNFDHAFPILQKFDLPATFFVVSGAIDGRSVLWWDRLTHIICALADARDRDDSLPERMPDWLTAAIRESTAAADALPIARRLVEQFNRMPRRERQDRLQALFAAAKSLEAAGSLMMSWDQLRAMKQAGMSIGAHTVTHDFLDELDDGKAQEEVDGCFGAIEQQTGPAPRVFAFPRGRCTPGLERVLERARVNAAVTTVHGLNGPRTGLFGLRRIDAGYCNSGAVFDPAVFDVELGGWFSPFRRS
jgi:peptidoglycan/xylan/chitin deacetylase (PgdA/CDA1 family)